MTHDNSCGPGPSTSSPSTTSDSAISNNVECSPSLLLNGSLDDQVEGEASNGFVTAVDESSQPPLITDDPANLPMSCTPLDTSLEEMLMLDDDRPPPEIDLMVAQPSFRRKKHHPEPLTAAMISQLPSCAIPTLPKSFFDSFYISSSDEEKKEGGKSVEPSRRKRVFLSKSDRTILAAMKSPKPSTSKVMERERETMKKKLSEGNFLGDVGSREGRVMHRRSLGPRFNSPVKKLAKKDVSIKKPEEKKVPKKTSIRNSSSETDYAETLSAVEEFKPSPSPPANSQTENDSDVEVILSDSAAIPKITEMALSSENQTESSNPASPIKQQPSCTSFLPDKLELEESVEFLVTTAKPEKVKSIPQLKQCRIPLVRLEHCGMLKKASTTKLPHPVEYLSSCIEKTSRVPDMCIAANSSESDSELDNLFEPVSPTQVKRVMRDNGNRSQNIPFKLSGPKSAQRKLQNRFNAVDRQLDEQSPFVLLKDDKTILNSSNEDKNDFDNDSLSLKDRLAKTKAGQNNGVGSTAHDTTKISTNGYSKQVRCMDEQLTSISKQVNGNNLEELQNVNLLNDYGVIKHPIHIESAKPSQSISTQTDLTMEEIEKLLSLKDKMDFKGLEECHGKTNGICSNGVSPSSSDEKSNSKKRKTRVSKRELNTLLQETDISATVVGGLKNQVNGNHCTSSDDPLTPENSSANLRKSSRAKKLRVDNDWIFFPSM